MPHVFKQAYPCQFIARYQKDGRQARQRNMINEPRNK